MNYGSRFEVKIDDASIRSGEVERVLNNHFNKEVEVDELDWGE